MAREPINPLPKLYARHRPAKLRFRHTVATAAYELGIPVSWVWFWAYHGWLRAGRWLGRSDWVRLEDVKKAFCNPQAALAAFDATGEPIWSQEAGELLLSKWPRMPEEIWQPECDGCEPSESEPRAA